MKATQARFDHLEAELGKRNMIIRDLQEDGEMLDYLNGKIRWARFPFVLGEPSRVSIGRAMKKEANR